MAIIPIYNDEKNLYNIVPTIDEIKTELKDDNASIYKQLDHMKRFNMKNWKYKYNYNHK